MQPPRTINKDINPKGEKKLLIKFLACLLPWPIPFDPTGAGCVGVTGAVLSPVCSIHNPVKGFGGDFVKHSRSFVTCPKHNAIFDVFLEHANYGAARIFVDNQGSASVIESRKQLGSYGFLGYRSRIW